MNIISKINFFYKEAQSKDIELNNLARAYESSATTLLNYVRMAYAHYFQSLGKDKTNEQRAKEYDKAMENAIASVSILINNFLKTNDINFIEQIAKLVLDASSFARAEVIRKWYLTNRSSPERYSYYESILAGAIKFKEAYANLKNYIYK